MTTTPEAVVNVGADLLADAVADQAAPVTRVDWRPPMPGTEADLATVAADPLRRTANERALAAVLGVTARLVDVAPAAEVLGLERGEFLHAGPPITWDRASGPLRGALMGAAAFEGLVDDPEDAVALFESGSGVSLEPCHHRCAVGPMAGVVTPSMWMFVLEDPASGRRTYCSLNEGLGKVLRYGAYGPEVLTRLRWMGDVLGPLLQQAVRATGPVDVTGILTQMLQMGDEAHNRNRAGTLMLLRDLSPGDGHQRRRHRGRRRVAALRRRQRPLLPQPRDARLQARARRGPRHRGLDDGRRDGPQRHRLRHPGRRHRATSGSPVRPSWPTGSSSASYGPDDANPDIGDSAITETAGIGGFAMATAPAIVRLVGGSVPDALATTRRMHEITLGENPRWSVPVLEFQGTPTGIDVTMVCRTGHPAADQHRHGRPGRRRRAGRRRAGHAAGRDLPPGAAAGWRAGGRQSATLMSTLPDGRSGVPSSR